MPVDRASPAAQIANELRAQIEAGDFKPGDRLPSDGELARHFDVSMATISKARAMLVALRLVESRAGAPSLVRDTSRDAVTGADRITRAHRTGRIYPDGHYARILSAQLVSASMEVASSLGVPEGSRTIERQRITLGPADTPLSKSITYLSGDLAEQCPALLETARIQQGTSLYVEQQTGRAPHSLASAVWCRTGGSGPESDAEQLGLAWDSFVLAVSTTTYDEHGLAISYEIELHPPDTRIALDVISV